MQVGFVGKPSVGKSTLFKASTLMDVDIANYPFTTIGKNEGVGFVRVDCVDKEFNVQCNPREGFCVNHIRFVPVQLVDVAGLVPGAHEGKGMGNQFLDDLNQADCLIHVIDASGSTNAKGEPVDSGSYDPAEDIRFLEVELDMWYLRIFKKVWEKFSRQVKQEHIDPVKAIAKQFGGLGVTEDLVASTLKQLQLAPLDIAKWNEDELKVIVSSFRKATKPMVIAANKSDTMEGKKNVNILQEQFPEHLIIPCSADAELALKEAAKHKLIDYIPGSKEFAVIGTLTEKQEQALQFIRKHVLEVFGTTGVQDILDAAVFNILRYKAIFPGGVGKLQDADGNYLPDCFLLPSNTTALGFAYKLHTDLGENFIKAVNVKTKMPVGKDHVLEHRDVIEIMAK